MAMEKFWPSIGTVPFTANGTITGHITLASATGFKVKMQIIVTSATQPTLSLEVKRVPSGTVLEVGPRGTHIDDRVNLSAYLLADGAAITANFQKRPSIPLQELERAVYAEEPTVAIRVVQVDQYGNIIGGGGGVSSDVNLISVGGSAISLGQQDMAHSIPIVIASNQSAIPVTFGLDAIAPQFNIVPAVSLIGSTPATAVTLLVASTDRKMFTLKNTLNRSVRLTLNGTLWLELDFNTNASFDFASNGKKLAAGDVIGAYYVSQKPNVGTLALSLI